MTIDRWEVPDRLPRHETTLPRLHRNVSHSPLLLCENQAVAIPNSFKNEGSGAVTSQSMGHDTILVWINGRDAPGIMAGLLDILSIIMGCDGRGGAGRTTSHSTGNCRA